MDSRFWIGNSTPDEIIKELAELLHSQGYRRGYYHTAERDIDEYIGAGLNGFWFVDVKKVAQVAWPDTPAGVGVNITRMVLEEVCHAVGRVTHKTPQEESTWRDFFIELAKGY
tara:strand:- start:247 stop:585 length:339 start_codon:yes stop_codon:yes gene_type:complete